MPTTPKTQTSMVDVLGGARTSARATSRTTDSNQRAFAATYDAQVDQHADAKHTGPNQSASTTDTTAEAGLDTKDMKSSGAVAVSSARAKADHDKLSLDMSLAKQAGKAAMTQEASTSKAKLAAIATQDAVVAKAKAALTSGPSKPINTTLTDAGSALDETIDGPIEQAPKSKPSAKVAAATSTSTDASTQAIGSIEQTQSLMDPTVRDGKSTTKSPTSPMTGQANGQASRTDSLADQASAAAGSHQSVDSAQSGSTSTTKSLPGDDNPAPSTLPQGSHADPKQPKPLGDSTPRAATPATAPDSPSATQSAANTTADISTQTIGKAQTLASSRQRANEQQGSVSGKPPETLLGGATSDAKASTSTDQARSPAGKPSHANARPDSHQATTLMAANANAQHATKTAQTSATKIATSLNTMQGIAAHSKQAKPAEPKSRIQLADGKLPMTTRGLHFEPKGKLSEAPSTAITSAMSSRLIMSNGDNTLTTLSGMTNGLAGGQQMAGAGLFTDAVASLRSPQQASGTEAVFELMEGVVDLSSTAEELPSQLGEKLSLVLNRGLERAEIQVRPEGMGPIRIEIAMQGQEAHVQFQAAHADTRALLNESADALRAALAERGVQLGSSQVGDQTDSRQGNQQDNRQNDGYSQQRDAQHHRNPEQPARQTLTQAPRVGPGNVDLFA